MSPNNLTPCKYENQTKLHSHPHNSRNSRSRWQLSHRSRNGMVRNYPNETTSHSSKNSIPHSLEYHFCMYDNFSSNDLQQRKERKELQNSPHSICSQCNFERTLELSVFLPGGRPICINRNDFHRSYHNSLDLFDVEKFQISRYTSTPISIMGRICNFLDLPNPKLERINLGVLRSRVQISSPPDQEETTKT
jgi:hypothetical protein